MQFANQNYYPQMQQQNYNPYIDRMNYLQQYQQNLQQPMLPTQMSGANQFTPLGKIVESVDMVKATDIPMDGNVYYFPKADGSSIYSKRWLANGQTQILAFEPILGDNPNTLSNDDEKLKFNALGQVLEGIQNDIKLINDKIDKISKPSKSKKESVEDATE
jgi:hypothetical protein